MRLIEISLLALALNVAGVTLWTGSVSAQSARVALTPAADRVPVRAPELEGKVLPAALVLLVGASALVISRRRRNKAKA